MFAENLDAFFDVAGGFASSATIAGVPVLCIFDKEARDVLFAAGNSPQLTVKSADVYATPRGAAVVVNGSSYTVAKIEHDGTGLARVLLELEQFGVGLEGGLGGIELEDGSGRILKEISA